MTLLQLGEFSTWKDENVLSVLARVMTQLQKKSAVTPEEGQSMLQELEGIAGFMGGHEWVRRIHKIRLEMERLSDIALRDTLFEVATGCKRLELVQFRSRRNQTSSPVRREKNLKTAIHGLRAYEKARASSTSTEEALDKMAIDSKGKKNFRQAAGKTYQNRVLTAVEGGLLSREDVASLLELPFD